MNGIITEKIINVVYQLFFTNNYTVGLFGDYMYLEFNKTNSLKQGLSSY